MCRSEENIKKIHEMDINTKNWVDSAQDYWGVFVNASQINQIWKVDFADNITGTGK